MNDVMKKFSKLSTEQSKALAEQMNAAYNKGGKKQAQTTIQKKPPSKKK